MNYQTLKTELLVALRGSKSTKEISRSLGYSFDKVRRWELGQKHLRWDAFCEYCEVLKVPLAETLCKLMTFDPKQVDLNDITKYVVQQMRKRYPNETNEQMADKLNCHLSVLKRYLSAEISPDIEFVFALLNLNQFFLGTFIIRLLPSNYGGPLRTQFAREEMFLRDESRSPFSIAVETALALADYIALPEHDDRYLALKSGCTVGEVRLILESGLRSGTVIRHDNGKYKATFNVENPCGANRAFFIRAIRLWTERALLRLENGNPINHREDLVGIGGFTVSTASKSAILQINEILLRANDQIAGVLRADNEPCEEIRVSVWHSFNSADVPERFMDHGLNPEAVGVLNSIVT